jgi:ATP-dependent RNA helicase UAP56/SUB2
LCFFPAVFVITSLQELDPAEADQPSVLVLAPTRELAFQIATEYQRFKKHMPGIRLALFYGGTPLAIDIQKLQMNSVQIVIGTPGRLLALIGAKALNLSHIKVFIVDECDKMLLGKAMREDVQKIFLATPPAKQVMMLSATMPKEIVPICHQFMKVALVILATPDLKSN